MTEWTIVGVIVVLIGLIASVVKPIVSLTRSITTLNCTVQQIQDGFKDYYITNTKSHDRLWEHNNLQDIKIDDHEKRIIKLEK